MESRKDREDFEDQIREDIRQEIMNGSNNGKKTNRYKQQIAELEMVSSGAAVVVKKTARNKEISKSEDLINIYQEETNAHPSNFWKGYFYLCGTLVVISVIFLSYVWRSIKLYETTRPENILDTEIAALQVGASADKIVFPTLSENEFSSEEEMKDAYLENLQDHTLSYRFLKQDYETGEQYYTLYADEEGVARITLNSISEQNRLGFLHIAKLEVEKIEPIMDILTWNYDITVFDQDKVYINDIQVSPKYQVGEAKDINEFAYLYEYVDMPREVTYHVDNIYQEAQIKIVDANGQEVPASIEGNQVTAMLDEVAAQKTLPEEIASEIDVLQAAKTWSLFTTRDLAGASHGIDQVRQYFIKDSYYWQKLGEYAKGIDITLVSDHDSSSTYFTEEEATEYRSFGETCFSCKIHFQKHMQLTIGREQVDTTDSIFYFVKLDDTDDGVDNATWKIADIQAVVNPSSN